MIYRFLYIFVDTAQRLVNLAAPWFFEVRFKAKRETGARKAKPVLPPQL